MKACPLLFVLITITSCEAKRTSEIVRFNSNGTLLEGKLELPGTSGKFPVVVFVHGSGRATRSDYQEFVEPFLANNIAVFRYDKRGVGNSSGSYMDVNVGTENSSVTIPLLARDAAAALRYLKHNIHIDSSRCFLLGASQAGWIIPVVADLVGISGTIIFSGPTVTVGEEMYYSRLAENGRYSVEDANKMAFAYSEHEGFDPLPYVNKLNKPSLWLFGDQDESIPADHCVSLLKQIRDQYQLPIEIQVIPGVNHSMRFKNGTRTDYGGRILAWLLGQLK